MVTIYGQWLKMLTVGNIVVVGPQKKMAVFLRVRDTGLKILLQRSNVEMNSQQFAKPSST
jgi:hypothetical protein